MLSWFHATILAVGIAATATVGIASASMLASFSGVAAKGDRLSSPTIDQNGYRTIETRAPGFSVLTRVKVD